MIFCLTQRDNYCLLGTHVGERRRDSGFYDLLASEARLCCFVAIAQGQPAAGELVCPGAPAHDCRWRAILLSWSGSMFEYLNAFFSWDAGLTNTHCSTRPIRPRVDRHIEYGKQRGPLTLGRVPESGL